MQLVKGWSTQTQPADSLACCRDIKTNLIQLEPEKEVGGQRGEELKDKKQTCWKRENPTRVDGTKVQEKSQIQFIYSFHIHRFWYDWVIAAVADRCFCDCKVASLSPQVIWLWRVNTSFPLAAVYWCKPLHLQLLWFLSEQQLFSPSWNVQYSVPNYPN